MNNPARNSVDDPQTHGNPLSSEGATMPVATGHASDESASESSSSVSRPLPPHGRSRLLMSRQDTGLLVIDVQERLLPSIHEYQRVTWNIRRLLDGARILGVPRMATEQYPKGLGGTVAELADRVEIDDEKLMFSCRDCEGVARRLAGQNVQRVLMCGIETHVCVQQSVLDFLAMGFDVWLAVDACGSRNRLDHDVALRRMESAGANLTTTEAALFEWCEVAATPEFKRISALVRESPPSITSVPVSAQFPVLRPRFVLQTDHRQSPIGEDQQLTRLCYIVRRTDDGSEYARFEGQKIVETGSGGKTVSEGGVVACEFGSDGTTLSLQHFDGSIEMVYLPVGDPRTIHPRWKVRRHERHIRSAEYETDYEITFTVVNYETGSVFHEFRGFEHRKPDGQGFSHVSGVRQVEISSDGRWLSITAVGRPVELIALPETSVV